MTLEDGKDHSEWTKADTLRPPAPETIPAPPPVHTCSCGRELALDEWLRLPLAGYFELDAESFAEMRTCSCASSRSVPVDDLKAADHAAWFAEVSAERSRAYMRVKRNPSARALSALDIIRRVLSANPPPARRTDDLAEIHHLCADHCTEALTMNDFHVEATS